jgi:type IV secretory pathway protease TraF
MSVARFDRWAVLHLIAGIAAAMAAASIVMALGVCGGERWLLAAGIGLGLYALGARPAIHYAEKKRRG